MPHDPDSRRLKIVIAAFAECVYQMTLMSAFQLSQDKGGFLAIDNYEKKYLPGHLDLGYISYLSNTGWP
jgi:hypothetical protein